MFDSPSVTRSWRIEYCEIEIDHAVAPELPDGTINLGRYGLLGVAGKTVPEIEAVVRAQIEAQSTNGRPWRRAPR